jgi:hypothetical protein
MTSKERGFGFFGQHSFLNNPTNQREYDEEQPQQQQQQQQQPPSSCVDE